MEKQTISGLRMLQIKNLVKKYTAVIFACGFFLSINIESSNPIHSISIDSDYTPAQKEIAYGKNGMVTTQHFIATRVGENILNKGGNAYDASIAIAFTLAVVLPRAGNIGGGGFMVIYDKNTQKSYSIDYREKAPKLSSKEDNSDNAESKLGRNDKVELISPSGEKIKVKFKKIDQYLMKGYTRV